MFKTQKTGPKQFKITMNEGDFGIVLPISFSNIQDGETIKVIIKEKSKEETKILDLDFTTSSNKIDFQLTKDETAKLNKGRYLFDMKHYRDDTLQNTLLVDNDYIVDEGA